VSAHRFLADGNRRNVQLAGPWLRSFTLLRVDGTEQGRTAAGEETLVLLLGGTFDLFARGSSWLQRGLRADAFGGRPCGLYLPPEVPYRFVGNGEILLVAGKRPPEKPQTPADAKAARASMPLLPLAGSGKAYDARTGQWELLERFPSSPEGVLPRAIETLRVGDVKVERVFSFAFKALTLCLDECALAAGQRVVVPPPLTPPNTRYGDELALFVRCVGTADVRSREVTTCTGDVVVPCAPGAPVEVTAGDASAYVVAVWAGDKNP
jgi:hypothetical protein